LLPFQPFSPLRRAFFFKGHPQFGFKPTVAWNQTLS
jgi:hypothetical protein